MALQNLKATQLRTRLTTAVIGSSVTLAVGAFVLLHTLQSEYEAGLRRQFLTPIVATSWAVMDSTLPLTLASDVESIPGVTEAIPWGIPYGLVWNNHHQYDVDPAYRNEVAGQEEVAMTVVPVDLAGLARQGLLENLRPEEVGGAAVVTEDLALRLGLQIGDVLELQDRGPKKRLEQERLTLQVREVLASPLSNTGATMVLADWSTLKPRDEYQHLWHLSIAAPEDRLNTIIAELERLSETYPELRWSTEAQAKAQFQREMGQRFALLWTTVGAMLLMGSIAMVNTLGASLYSRLREMAILRAIGLTPQGLTRLVMIETLLYGLGALLTGLLGGGGFAYLVSRSLGSDQMAVPWSLVAVVFLATLLGVAVVGIGFARSISRLPVTENLTTDLG